MKRRLVILFSLLVPLLCVPCTAGFYAVAAPPVEDMDKALDKYELLCDECVDLMLRLEAGEKVSRSVVSGLLSSLSDLRKLLRESSGSMTPAQRKRFERIKERYAMAAGGPKETERVPVSVPEPPVKTAPPVVMPVAPAVAEVKVERKSMGDTLQALSYSFPSVVGMEISGPQRSARLVTSAMRRKQAKRRFTYSLGASISVVPDLSYGAVFSMMSNANGFGGYVKFTGNFASFDYDYECLSDGSFSGGTIWTNGNSSVSVMNFTAGLRKNFWPFLGCYAGAGYGRYATFWYDVSDNRAKVTDYSVSGASFECGLLLDLGYVEFSAGVSTIAFRYSSLDLGISIRF